MDELIQILRRIATGPEFDEDVVALSAPPVASGIGSLPATARTIASIAQRSPDLIRWLASGKVLKQGGSTWNRLTQGLTSAQKRMVAENPQMFRNYFRRVRQPNEAVRVGQGTGPGTSLVRRPTVEVSRTTGTAVGPRSPGGIATIPASMGAGAASGASGRSLLPWLLGGGAGAFTLSQLLGGEEAPAAPEVRPDVRGRGAHMNMLESFQGQRPPAPTAPVVERMRSLMPSAPTKLIDRGVELRRADMGVPVQDVVMAELRREPEMRRQFVKSDIPGVMGTWQDLPYELQPATTLSEREIRRMIEASR